MNEYVSLGLMSGTSLDGLDIAICKFWQDEGEWKYDLLWGEVIEFPPSVLDRLAKAPKLSGQALSLLHVEYGEWMGQKVNEVIRSTAITPDLVASHGYTVFHQPEKKLTLQIGSGYAIHAQCGIPVVCDFRALDVALGGHGAPLVPIGDQMLFGVYDFCLNLGGIANISTQIDNQRIAYDIVPVNMVMNSLARRIHQPYDDRGQLASTGKLIPELLESLERLEYFHQPPPKSLGSEWVVNHVWALVNKFDHSVNDLLHTYADHIARRISEDIESLSVVKEQGKTFNILLTGGGTHNEYLVSLLRKYLSQEKHVTVPSKELIEFKEAVIFAFLGILKASNACNVLSSVTGASKDNSGGVIIGSINPTFST